MIRDTRRYIAQNKMIHKVTKINTNVNEVWWVFKIFYSVEVMKDRALSVFSDVETHRSYNISIKIEIKIFKYILAMKKNWKKKTTTEISLITCPIFAKKRCLLTVLVGMQECTKCAAMYKFWMLITLNVWASWRQTKYNFTVAIFIIWRPQETYPAAAKYMYISGGHQISFWRQPDKIFFSLTAKGLP